MPPGRTDEPQARTRAKGEACKKVGVKLSGDKWASVLDDQQAAQQCQKAALSDARSVVEAKGKNISCIKSVALTPTETGGKATFVVTETDAVDVKGYLASCKFPLLCKVYAEELKKMSRDKKAKTPANEQSDHPEAKSNLAQLVERVSSGVTDFFNVGESKESCQFSLPGTKWQKLVSEQESDCRNAVCDDISEMIPNSFNRNTFNVEFDPQKSCLIMYCTFDELRGNGKGIEARQAELRACLFPRLKALYSGQRPSLVWPAERVLFRPRKLSHFYDDDELVEDSEVGRESTLHKNTQEEGFQEEEFAPVEEHIEQEEPPVHHGNLYAEEHISDRQKAETPVSLPSSQTRKSAVYRQISSASVKGFRLEFDGEAWPILLNSFNHVFVEALRNDLIGAFTIIGKQMPDVEINFSPTDQGSTAEIHFADAETSSVDEDNERYDLFSQYSYEHVWDKYNELLGQCEGRFGSNPDFTLLLSGAHWPVLLEKYPHAFQKAAQDDAYLALRASGEPQPPMIKSSITLQGEHARLLYYIAFNSNQDVAQHRIGVLQNYPYPTIWATYAMYSTALTSSIEVPSEQVARKLRTPFDVTPIEYYPKGTCYSQSSHENSRGSIPVEPPLPPLPAIPTACIGVQTHIPLTSTGMQTQNSAFNSIGMQTYPLFSQECVGVQTNQPKLTSIGLQAAGDRHLQACIAVQTNKVTQESVAMQTQPVPQPQACVGIQTSRMIGTSVGQQTRKISQTSVGIQKAPSFYDNPEILSSNQIPVVRAPPKMAEETKKVESSHMQCPCCHSHCHPHHCFCHHIDRCRVDQQYQCGCRCFRVCDHDYSHRNPSVRVDINFNTNTNTNGNPACPTSLASEAPQAKQRTADHHEEALESARVMPLYRDGTPESARVMPLYRDGTPESARVMPLFRDGTPESARVMPLYRDGTPESARVMPLFRDGTPGSARAVSLNKDGTAESVWAVSFNQDGSPCSVRTVSIFKDGTHESRAASRGPEKQSDNPIIADAVNRSAPVFNSVYSSISELDTASTHDAKPIAWAQAPPHVNSSVLSYDQASNPPSGSSSGKTYRVGFPGKEWTAIAERNIKSFVSILEEELTGMLPIHHAIVEEVYTDEVYGIIATVRVFDPRASSRRIRSILKVGSFPAIWKLYDKEQYHCTPRLKCIDLPPVRPGKQWNGEEKPLRNVITCHTVRFDGIGWYQILHTNRRILVEAVEKDLLSMGQFPVSDVAVGNPVFDKRGAALDLRIDHPVDVKVEDFLHPKNFKNVWRLYRGQRKVIQSS